MKEQLHDDSFEDFLRGKLNEFDDEPQAEMWNRIESVIPPAPKPALYRYFTSSAIAASLLVAVIAVAGLYQYRSNQNLNDRLVEASEKIRTLEAEIGQETVQEAKTAEENSLNAKIDPAQKEALAPNEAPAKAENPKNIEDKSIKNNSDFKPSKNGNAQNLAGNSKKSTAPKSRIINNKKTENSATVAPDNSNLNTLPPMANEGSLNHQGIEDLQLSPKEEANEITPDFIKTLGFQNLASLNKIDHIDSLKINTPDFSPNGWAVAAFVQPLVTHTYFKEKMGGGKPSSDSSKHYIKPALGWAVGANLGYRVNKHWAFYGGVAYQKEFAYLNFSERLKYDKDFETDINSERQNYEQTYESNSPFGNMGLNVRFSKSKSDNIPSETPFEVNIKGTFETTSLNIPLYAQYQTQKGRLKYGIKLGFATQIVLDKAFTSEDLTCSEAALKPIETKVNKQPKWEHKVSIDNLLGASLAYAITPQLDLSIEPTALLSVSSPHRNDKGSLSRVSSGVQMGVRYAF